MRNAHNSMLVWSRTHETYPKYNITNSPERPVKQYVDAVYDFMPYNDFPKGKNF